ncbi:MAG: hypothetical protein QXJ68_04555 [Methanocellales archaeon]
MERERIFNRIRDEARKFGFEKIELVEGDSLYTPQEFFFVDSKKIYEFTGQENRLLVGKKYIEMLSTLNEELLEKKIKYDVRHEKAHLSGGRFTRENIEFFMKRLNKNKLGEADLVYLQSLATAIEAQTELITLIKFYSSVELYLDEFAASIAGAAIYSIMKAESFSIKVFKAFSPKIYKEMLQKLGEKEGERIQRKVFEDLFWANDVFKDMFAKKFANYMERYIQC